MDFQHPMIWFQNITQIPTLDFAADPADPYRYPQANLYAGDALSYNDTNANVIVYSQIPLAVCKQIALIAQGNTTFVEVYPGGPNTATLMAALKPFNCLKSNYSENYYFYYRVF